MDPSSVPKPPWIQYPGTDPVWGGWRQGYSEAWFLKIWLPFWSGLSEIQRREFLDQWPPPDDEWRYYATQVWR